MALNETVDFFLDYLRVDITKALDPNKPKHFLQICRQLQDAVRGLTGAVEAKALRAAIDTLDVDWAKMSAAQRDKVMVAAKGALSKPADIVPAKIEETFTVFGKKVAKDTKTSAKSTYELSITGDLSKTDHKVIEAVAGSQGNFVRDQYGRLSTALTDTAKDVVESGLGQGLGSKEISQNIQDALGEQAAARSSAYWDMIAMTFANRSRTYGNLSGYAEAGFQWFRFEAVMDERTSQICELMHGRRFSVAKSVARFEDYEKNDSPEDIVDRHPWVSAGVDDDGNRGLFWRGSDGERRQVAAVGDDGKFSNAMSNAALEKAGITVPPLHGNCRSTILPAD